MPTRLEQRAQVYRWVMFAMTELEQPLWRMAKHTFLYPENKRLPQDIDLARDDFTAMAAVLDRHMKGRQYIVGDHMTAADCVTAYLMDWANEHHLLDGFPNLKAYLQRMYERSTAPQRIAEALATIRRDLEPQTRDGRAITGLTGNRPFAPYRQIPITGWFCRARLRARP